MNSSIQIEASIEALKKKKSSLELLIGEMDLKYQALVKRKNSEEADVNKLNEESFMTSFLKLIKLHEGKLSKESEEYLRAKLDLEKHESEWAVSKKQLHTLEARIFELELSLKDHQEVLDRQKNKILALPVETPQRVLYTKLRDKYLLLQNEGIEIQEAITAHEQAASSLMLTMGQLDNADSWATWDVWGGGGLLTDMIKYEEIDTAKVEMERLSAHLKILSRELSDIDSMANLAIFELDEMTVAFDIWFDNFFTDYSVREEIRSQISSLENLGQKLSLLKTQLLYKLESNHGSLNACSESLEHLLLETIEE